MEGSAVVYIIELAHYHLWYKDSGLVLGWRVSVQSIWYIFLLFLFYKWSTLILGCVHSCSSLLWPGKTYSLYTAVWIGRAALCNSHDTAEKQQGVGTRLHRDWHTNEKCWKYSSPEESSGTIREYQHDIGHSISVESKDLPLFIHDASCALSTEALSLWYNNAELQ